MRIVFENDEGAVSIIIPAPGVNVLDCIGAVPNGKKYYIVPADSIPQNRDNRQNWTLSDSGEIITGAE